MKERLELPSPIQRNIPRGDVKTDQFPEEIGPRAVRARVPGSRRPICDVWPAPLPHTTHGDTAKGLKGVRKARLETSEW